MEGNSIVANDTLDGIAQAINAKLGTSGKMTVQQMAGKVGAIVTKSDMGTLTFQDNFICYNDDTSILEAGLYGTQTLHYISHPKLLSVGPYAFSECNALREVSLPNVVDIGPSAFLFCISLTHLILPKATTIGGDSFFGANNNLFLDLSSMTQA